MTSEETHGIVEQPDETCPLINDAIREINKALESLRGWEKCGDDDASELRDKCDYAVWHLRDVEDTLESVRKRVTEIRAWGQEWKDLAKEYAPKAEPV